MKRYFLNSYNNKLHRSNSTDARCHKANQEHQKEYESIEEVKNSRESAVVFCKICMKEEIKEFGNII